MADGHRRVTVLTPRHKVELDILDSATAPEVVADVVSAVPALSTSSATDGLWRLSSPVLGALRPDRPLAESGIRDGDGLHLLPLESSMRAPEILPEAFGGSGEKSANSWRPLDGLTTLAVLALVAAFASLTALLAPWPARLGGPGRGGMAKPDAMTTTVIAAVALAAVGVGLAHLRLFGPQRRRVARVLLSISAAYGLTAALLMPRPPSPAPMTERLAILLSVIAGVGLLAVAVDPRAVLSRGIAVAAAIAAVPVIGVAELAQVTGLTDNSTFVVLALFAALGLRSSAPLAVRSYQLFIGAAEAHHANRAMFTALLCGFGTVLILAWAFLSGGHGYVLWVTLTSAAVALMRPQRMRARRDRAITTCFAVVGGAAITAVTLSVLDGFVSRLALLAMIALASVALLFAARPLRFPLTVRTAADWTESLAVAALVPLVAGQLGLFTEVMRLAHRWMGA